MKPLYSLSLLFLFVASPTFADVRNGPNNYVHHKNCSVDFNPDQLILQGSVGAFDQTADGVKTKFEQKRAAIKSLVNETGGKLIELGTATKYGREQGDFEKPPGFLMFERAEILYPSHFDVIKVLDKFVHAGLDPGDWTNKRIPNGFLVPVVYRINDLTEKLKNAAEGCIAEGVKEICQKNPFQESERECLAGAATRLKTHLCQFRTNAGSADRQAHFNCFGGPSSADFEFSGSQNFFTTISLEYYPGNK